MPAYVEVIPVPGGSPVFRAHPHWVRLLTDDERVRLASSYRQVEVGSFLAPVERQTLAETRKLARRQRWRQPTTLRV